MYISSILAIVIAMVLAIPIVIDSVYAGGIRYDYPENYEDVPGAPECWSDGFDDGANDSFDKDRDKECADKGDLYSRGFNAGIESYTEKNMERSSSVEKDCKDARND